MATVVSSLGGGYRALLVEEMQHPCGFSLSEVYLIQNPFSKESATRNLVRRLGA